MLGFYGLLFFLDGLDKLGIPIGAVFLVVLGVGVWLVLFLPKPFIKSLQNFVWSPKSANAQRTDSDIALRLALVLVIRRIHDGFWSFVTKYYPFSLLYQDRLFHAQNANVRSFITALETYAQKIGMPFVIREGNGSGAMSLFWAQQSGGKKIKKEAYTQQLQEKLQAKYETIYVSPETKGFTIHVPRSMVE